jgi:RNA polymerase sigma-70 factor (ECF subfamily)
MSLLEMATMGNRAAWEQIVYLYSPLVDRWCRRRFLREDVIDEIGQDVFLKLFKYLGSFRKDDPQFGFRKWLWTLTRNKVLDHLRKVRGEPRCVGGSEGQGIIDNYPNELARFEQGDDGARTPPDERLILLRRCLELVKSEFEPRTYEAFWQIVLNGKAPVDVAKSLGMKSVGAAYTARSRVMSRLRELVAELGEEFSGL